MEITDEQLAKLPKWAREHIDRLERTIKTQSAQLAELNGDAEKSDTIANPYASLKRDGSQPVALGNGTTVQFNLTGSRGDSIRAQINDRGHGRELEIDGDYALNVRVGSSNLVYLSIVERLASKS